MYNCWTYTGCKENNSSTTPSSLAPKLNSTHLVNTTPYTSQITTTEEIDAILTAAGSPKIPASSTQVIATSPSPRPKNFHNTFNTINDTTPLRNPPKSGANI